MLSYKGEPPWSQRAYLDSYRVPLIASMPVRATPSVHPGKYQVQPMNNHESTLIFFIVSSYISRQIKSRLNKTPPNFSVIQTFLQGWPLYDRVLSMPRASLLLRRGPSISYGVYAQRGELDTLRSRRGRGSQRSPSMLSSSSSSSIATVDGEYARLLPSASQSAKNSSPSSLL